MDNKFYYLDDCPYCRGSLHEAGKSNSGQLILCCNNCNVTILENDIDKVRRERDENSKSG